MATLYDGLGGEELVQSGLTAGGQYVQPWFAGSITSASHIKGTTITASTGFSGATCVILTGSFVTAVRANNMIAVGSITNAEGYINSVRQGASYGGFVQAGSNVTSAGSSAWVAYPVAYTAGPQSVIVSNRTTIGGMYVSGTPSAGSFLVIAETAADAFNWIAVGVK